MRKAAFHSYYIRYQPIDRLCCASCYPRDAYVRGLATAYQTSYPAQYPDQYQSITKAISNQPTLLSTRIRSFWL